MQTVIRFPIWASCLGLSLLMACQSGTANLPYELVLQGGRVIDPETQLDAVRDIGIRDGKIVAISAEALEGTVVQDVSGLVVAPGFIDLHVHGITNTEQAYQVRDGVTTALELEVGVPALTDWYAQREGTALINYGASANWVVNRVQNLAEGEAAFQAVQEAIRSGAYQGVNTLMGQFGRTFGQSLSPEEIQTMQAQVQASLEAGALGIGVPVGYLPGASREELFRLFQLAGEQKAPLFTHVRSGGTIAIQQAISDAVLTDAPLHIVHINSMALGEIELAIEMVQLAQQRGFDITTELYPYAAASTGIQTAILSPGWQDRLSITYEDLQWVETGERLTAESFAQYRAEGGLVIIHSMKPDWIAKGLAAEGVMIASDGMPYDPGAHPRTAGTFSRVLGHFVREQQTLSLMEALSKMTLLPAQRLEPISPQMRKKGRIQIGCDADLTIFDPATIQDRATFEDGLAYSSGVAYVLVNGQWIVKEGAIVEEVFPGTALFGKWKKDAH